MIAYHGGPPGLKIGQRILPAITTGVRSTAEFGASGVCDPGRVYVTTDTRMAAMFASLHPSGKGCVYKVAPLGNVTTDPDCAVPGLSYACASALITERIKVPRKTLLRLRKALMIEFR